MGVVVHPTDAPLVSGTVMLGVQDAVHDRSRMLRFGDDMSIFARRVREPSGNSPARMRSNRSRFSATERLRYGLSLPGWVRVPRYSGISSAERSSTYAFPALTSCMAHS